MKERPAMAPWILPTLGYVLVLGLSGVTTKLALRTITWQELVLWVPIAYGAFALAIVAIRGDRLPLGAGGGWAIATALCASTALILFFVALAHGDASRVVPATAAYPAVTLLASALFLSEAITASRVAGVALVIAGVVLVSR
jgi:transporter family protein